VTQIHRATLIGSVSILLWSTLALLTRLTEDKIPAFQLMAMTFTVAFILMNVRWWLQGHTGLRYLRQPPLSWAIGVGAYFAYHFCYFAAMSKAPVMEVSLLAYLWPLLIVLFSTLLPKARLTLQHVLGALLSFSGCWILLGQGVDGFSSEYLSGYLLAITCAFIWSSYSVASRFVKTVPTDAVGWFCAATAVMAFAGHLAWEITVWPENMSQWAGVMGLGLGPVGIAFFTWDYGVKHGNLQLLASLAYATPLISVLLLLAAGEGLFSASLIFSCFAIVGGSILAAYSPKTAKVA